MENDTYRFTMKHYDGTEVSITGRSDVHIGKLIEAFRAFLVGATFSENLVNAYVPEPDDDVYL